MILIECIHIMSQMLFNINLVSRYLFLIATFSYASSCMYSTNLYSVAIVNVVLVCHAISSLYFGKNRLIETKNPSNRSCLHYTDWLAHDFSPMPGLVESHYLQSF